MTAFFIVFVFFALIVLQRLVYKRFWRHGLSAEVKFSAKEAFEGDSLFLNEEFTNRKFLPLPWVYVEFNLSSFLMFDDGDIGNGTRRSVADLFSMKMFERIRRKQPFVCKKRGFYTLLGINIKANDLMHTRANEAFQKIYRELTVFPKLLEHSDLLEMLYKNLDAAVLSNALINPDPFEFKGIREYIPTDPLKDINFKATAISRELMVNIHAPVAAQRLEIILNLEPYNNQPYRELYEQSIRLAATVASRYINDDVQVGLYTNGRNNLSLITERVEMGQSSAHLYAILTALAHINLSNVSSPITPYIQSITETDAVYLLISCYHGKDMMQALASKKEAGVSVLTVIPAEQQNMPKIKHTADTLIWEAVS